MWCSFANKCYSWYFFLCKISFKIALQKTWKQLHFSLFLFVCRVEVCSKIKLFFFISHSLLSCVIDFFNFDWLILIHNVPYFHTKTPHIRQALYFYRYIFIWSYKEIKRNLFFVNKKKKSRYVHFKIVRSKRKGMRLELFKKCPAPPPIHSPHISTHIQCVLFFIFLCS